MKVYRLTKGKYAQSLDGTGASFSNNRWNSKGTSILYTAGSRSLALLEVLAHLPLGLTPSSYVMLTIELPNEMEIESLKVLPKNWNSMPYNKSSQKVGDDFIMAGKADILKVSSAIVSEEYNYLVSPKSQFFKKVKILHSQPFPIDKRFLF